MNRKIVAICLALIMALAWCVPAFAADPSLSVTGPEGAIAEGESFVVTVSISDNPGFATLIFTLPYDKQTLTCEAAKGGEVLQQMMYVTNPDADDGAMVSAISTDLVTDNGEIAVFKFTAKADLDSVSFSVTDAGLADLDGVEMNVNTESETAALETPDETAFEGLYDDGTDVGVGDYEITPEELEQVMSPDNEAAEPEEAAQEEAEAPGAELNETAAGDTDAAQTAGDTETAAGADTAAEAESAAEAETGAAEEGIRTGISEASDEAGTDSASSNGTSPVLWIVLVIVVIAAVAAVVVWRVRGNKKEQ